MRRLVVGVVLAFALAIPSAGLAEETSDGGIFCEEVAAESMLVATADFDPACPRIGGFYSFSDYPHQSTTARQQGILEVTTKGRFEVTSGPTGVLAVVTVWLQRWDGTVWRTVGSAQRTVRQRTNVVAAAPCALGVTRSWRGMVDVDIIGYSDPPTRPVTPARSVTCVL
jgi:hypothetical protein